MASMYLTAYQGQILGPIARVLGWIMNGVYIGLSNVFGIKDIWVTIVVFTIIIYMALLPLTVRQQKFSILQQKIAPETKAIQKKYKGKRDQASMMAQQEEQQALYDKYGISPMGSCLQMIIQLPILFGLYRVIYNIPAYIDIVKGVFSGLAGQIMSVDGYADVMQTIYKNAKINTVQVNFQTTDPTAMSNYIIDVLYKLGDSGWSALHTSFPTLTSAIDSTHSAMMGVNYFQSQYFRDSLESDQTGILRRSEGLGTGDCSPSDSDRLLFLPVSLDEIDAYCRGSRQRSDGTADEDDEYHDAAGITGYRIYSSGRLCPLLDHRFRCPCHSAVLPQ